MNIERVIKPLDRDTISNGRTKTYISYDQDLFHKIRRMAGREGTTVSALIHRLMEQATEEYYDGTK